MLQREQYEWGELSEDDVSRYVYNLMDATRLLDNMSEYMQQIEYVSQIKRAVRNRCVCYVATGIRPDIWQ